MSIYGTCKCNKNDATTECDKCKKGVCRKCATIIPVPPSVSKSGIQIMHRTCAPKKHLAKLELKGVEING
jgi:hypothetical protein